MTPLQIFLFLIIVVCQQCFANQEVNNEQCTSPSNPLFNQTIPWRIALEHGARLNIPENQPLVLTDTSGCVTFQLNLLSYQSIRAIATLNDAWAVLSGTLTDDCNGGASYSVYGRQNVDYQLIFVDSVAIQHATLVPLFILGTYTNGTYESEFTFTTERADFYSNRKPFYKSQFDDFRTFKNNSCTVRSRGDTGGNYMYSQPFHSVLAWNSGPQLEFIFPANIQLILYYYPGTNYYSQCPCDVDALTANSAASTGATSLPTNVPVPPPQ